MIYVLSMISSRSFIVSGLTFRCLIYFEFIFVYGVRKCSSLIVLQVVKQESSRKTSISALLTMPKPLTVWITINCGKF